jgi:hypothetical protein
MLEKDENRRNGNGPQYTDTHRVTGERFAGDGDLHCVECSRCAIMLFEGDAVRYVGSVVYATGCMLRIAPMLGLKNRFRARRPAA